jgi:hypothetical protein
VEAEFFVDLTSMVGKRNVACIAYIAHVKYT